MVQADVIIITGPTGSGKSKLALQLAKQFSGEIVNCDSVQMYRYFNIGSAKPDNIARKQIPHHLIDILDPCDKFSAGMFVENATRVIKQVTMRGNLPILVGGTGFYISALTNGLSSIPKIPEQISLQVKEKMNKFGAVALYKELQHIDPQYAATISEHDKQRISRSLEVFYATGKKLSSFHGKRNKPKWLRYLGIVLNQDRKLLYQKLNQRVLKMIKQGFIQEVEQLIKKGYGLECFPMKSLGYLQIFNYINENKNNMNDLIEEISKSHRHYAKRQITWFKKQKKFIFVEPEQFDLIVKLINRFSFERA